MSTATHCISCGGFVGKSQSIHNFHKCLEIILNPLQSNQGNNTPIYANIHFGDKVALCHVFSLACVMGDGLSSDKMCGCFLGYSNVSRLSRVYNVPFSSSDDPEYNHE